MWNKILKIVQVTNNPGGLSDGHTLQTYKQGHWNGLKNKRITWLIQINAEPWPDMGIDLIAARNEDCLEGSED